MLNAETDLEDVWNELAPGTEYEETRERDNQPQVPDTGSDLDVPITTSDEDLHEFHEMLDEPYRALMRSLNKEQTDFVNDTMHILKHSDEQIFRFLSGGAGVGKSFVVRALYQSALKYYNKHAGENFTAHNILLLNPTVIQRSQNPVYTIKAKDRVVESTPPGMRKRILEIFVKVNLNTADGLTNGASCKIIKIDIESQETYASGIIWVTFLDNSCGRTLRTELKKLYKPGYSKSWTPLQPVVKEFNAGKDGQAQVQRYQFPLRPAHAKSIHRSQGDTLDSAVVDLTLTRQVKHIHYVALSRLQSLEGLRILNLQENKIAVDKIVQAEMERLRGSPLTLQQQSLSDHPEHFKLAFVNARSLHRHIEDVRADRNVLAADVACFCETRFQDNDFINDTSLNNFVQYRQDYEQSTSRSRPPYGLAVHSKTSFTSGPFNESKQAEIAVFRVEGQEDVTFVFIYKPPRISAKALIEILANIQTSYLKDSKAVIFGDFNIDWCEQSQNNQILKTFMNKHSYSQILECPTNDFNSTIDLIFTNMDGCHN
ncbi:PIF1-like protein [Mya arenaria]|uniref:PIF1-like protein n=1 Tax=Mya arenaria TaxID=6604 RepID=A0ABY7FJ35_MYAAR|nr:PIF1-like protein [Mya arenaria]